MPQLDKSFFAPPSSLSASEEEEAGHSHFEWGREGGKEGGEGMTMLLSLRRKKGLWFSALDGQLQRRGALSTDHISGGDGRTQAPYINSEGRGFDNWRKF